MINVPIKLDEPVYYGGRHPFRFRNPDKQTAVDFDPNDMTRVSIQMIDPSTGDDCTMSLVMPKDNVPVHKYGTRCKLINPSLSIWKHGYAVSVRLDAEGIEPTDD